MYQGQGSLKLNPRNFAAVGACMCTDARREHEVVVRVVVLRFESWKKVECSIVVLQSRVTLFY